MDVGNRSKSGDQWKILSQVVRRVKIVEALITMGLCGSSDNGYLDPSIIDWSAKSGQ